MNTKRLAVILIAVAFTLVLLFSCVALFSVKEIEVDFAVSEETDTKSVQETLDKYLGKNLMFVDTEEVKSTLKDYQYMEVLSVEKKFPNVIKVKIEERRETYYLEHGENVYVTTADGFVLNVIEKSAYQGNVEWDKITLRVVDVDLSDETKSEQDADLTGKKIGETVSIVGDEFLGQVFEMAKSVKLTDCIEEIKVERVVNGAIIGAKDVVINTRTGVKIRIMDADNLGMEKMRRAFVEYDNASTDYVKTFNYILVGISNGEIVPEWSPIDNLGMGNG